MVGQDLLALGVVVDSWGRGVAAGGVAVGGRVVLGRVSHFPMPEAARARKRQRERNLLSFAPLNLFFPRRAISDFFGQWNAVALGLFRVQTEVGCWIRFASRLVWVTKVKISFVCFWASGLIFRPTIRVYVFLVNRSEATCCLLFS